MLTINSVFVHPDSLGAGLSRSSRETKNKSVNKFRSNTVIAKYNTNWPQQGNEAGERDQRHNYQSYMTVQLEGFHDSSLPTVMM